MHWRTRPSRRATLIGVVALAGAFGAVLCKRGATAHGDHGRRRVESEHAAEEQARAGGPHGSDQCRADRIRAASRTR